MSPANKPPSPLDTRGKANTVGSSKDRMATDGGERNATDGNFSDGEGPAEVEGSRCCPTRHPV